MKLIFIWPGKTKEDFIKEGIKKYIKDIKTMAQAEVKEIREVRGRPRETALREEGRRILEAAPKGFVLLDAGGRMMDSVEFARFLDGQSEWSFVVGGPYGVSEEIKETARQTMSFSKMTFPHELMRVMLLEQAYRALTIMRGKGYHH